MERLPVSVRNQMDSVDMEVGLDKPARLTIVNNFVLFVRSDIRLEIVGQCLGWCSSSKKSCFKVCFFQMRGGPILPSNSKCSHTGRYKDV